MPATPANTSGFPGLTAAQPTGPPTARPARARIRLLIDCGTRRTLSAEVVGPDEGERLPDGLRPGDLLVTDEQPVSARLWNAAEQHGAQVLWPLPQSAPISCATRLPDGSALAKLPAEDGPELVARIVPGAGPRRLATSLVDHRAVPAGELAAFYETPEVAGSGFDGAGAYAHGDRLELRSKDPEMVRQELYAMLCVHLAIGELVDPNPGDSACF
jgi:hypothetical protein